MAQCIDALDPLPLTPRRPGRMRGGSHQNTTAPCGGQRERTAFVRRTAELASDFRLRIASDDEWALTPRPRRPEYCAPAARRRDSTRLLVPGAPGASVASCSA